MAGPLLKFKERCLLFVVFNLALCAFAAAQQNSVIDIPKGKFVVLKVPGKLAGYEKVSSWNGNVSYSAIVEQSEKGGLIVSGLSEWRAAGWPLMRQLTFEKVSREKNYTLVELRDPLFSIKLRFDNTIKDLNASFHEIAFVGLLSEFEASDYYRNEVINTVLPRVFSGSLASIPTERKLNLLKELRYVDSAIRYEKYKGNDYLSIDVGGDTEVYNTIRVDQSHRIGHSLNQRVLAYFKRVARIIKFHQQVDGIKVTILIPYKNFVTESYNAPSYDQIEIYSPMDVIRQFADDELTNQEFVEESILLVNGNRMRIPELESL
jgi:hypothetical protein